MHLLATLVPPLPVVERLRAAVVAVEPPPPPRPVTSGVPGRHRLSRRRGESRTETPAPTGPMLNFVPPVAVHLPIAKFGSVTLQNAVRLADAIGAAAEEWAVPELHFAGGLVLEPVGDDGVWATLAGDHEALQEVRHGVARAAQGLQLFVDRRVFRPEVRVGTINGHTTEAYLEQVLAALTEYRGEPWSQTTITLASPAELGPDRPPYKVFRDLPIG